MTGSTEGAFGFPLAGLYGVRKSDVMALTTRTLGVSAAAIAALLASGVVFTYVTGAFRLGDLSNPKTGAQTSSQVTETVAVKKSPVAPLPQPRPPAEAAPAPIPPASSLRGLDEVNFKSGAEPHAAGAGCRPRQSKPLPNAFDPNAKGNETLPWDMVEPVPVAPPPPVDVKRAQAAKLPQPTSTAALPPPMKLPTEAMVSAWLKTKTTEIKGEDRARPLIHVELWLEPAPPFKGHLLAVTYSFSSPAIEPQSQTSRDATSGFRIAVGGLGCVDTITLTLTFDDARTQSVNVDGCRSAASSSTH